MDKILVTSPSMTSYEEYIDEIKSIWDTKWLTNMGPKHNQLEFELRTYLVRSRKNFIVYQWTFCFGIRASSYES